MRKNKLKVKLYDIQKCVCDKLDDLGYDLEEDKSGINATVYCNSLVNIGGDLNLISRNGDIAVIDKRLFNGYYAVLDT